MTSQASAEDVARDVVGAGGRLPRPIGREKARSVGRPRVGRGETAPLIIGPEAPSRETASGRLTCRLRIYKPDSSNVRAIISEGFLALVKFENVSDFNRMRTIYL